MYNVNDEMSLDPINTSVFNACVRAFPGCVVDVQTSDWSEVWFCGGEDDHGGVEDGSNVCRDIVK